MCFMANNADLLLPLSATPQHIMTTFQVRPPVRADCLLSSSQIENVDTCLSFLDARGVNVQGLSAEGKDAKQCTMDGMRNLLIKSRQQWEWTFCSLSFKTRGNNCILENILFA